MTLDTCPICGFRPSTITPNGDRATIHCERCGDFDLTGTTFDIAQHWGAGQQPARDPRGRFSASHAIRRMQVRGRPRPQINSKLLGAIWSQPLPPMQRQAELLILALGDQDLSPGEYVRWRIERFCAEVGTRDDPPTGLTSALNAVMRHLEGRFIEIERQPPSPNIGLRLTFDGSHARAQRPRVESTRKESRASTWLPTPTLRWLRCDRGSECLFPSRDSKPFVTCVLSIARSSTPGTSRCGLGNRRHRSGNAPSGAILIAPFLNPFTRMKAPRTMSRHRFLRNISSATALMGWFTRVFLGEGYSVALFDLSAADLINCCLHETKQLSFVFEEFWKR